MLVRPCLALVEQFGQFLGEVRFVHDDGHLSPGFQGCKVVAGQPGVRAEQFHIQGVVLPAVEDAGLIRVPLVVVVLAPGIFNGFSHRRPERSQPVGVAGDFPVAIGFDDVAKLAVGAGAEIAFFGFDAQGQFDAEVRAADLVDTVGVVCRPHRALQRREQKCQRLGVVPDVRA